MLHVVYTGLIISNGDFLPKIGIIITPTGKGLASRFLNKEACSIILQLNIIYLYS